MNTHLFVARILLSYNYIALNLYLDMFETLSNPLLKISLSSLTASSAPRKENFSTCSTSSTLIESNLTSLVLPHARLPPGLLPHDLTYSSMNQLKPNFPSSSESSLSSELSISPIRALSPPQLESHLLDRLIVSDESPS
ncbi:hypothetical protein BU15DRAFT_76425 [Melanogaster broomeanus]|nr:hypothetical protein BU15DRAFT_76425 [Melanogaster broomeanus]